MLSATTSYSFLLIQADGLLNANLSDTYLGSTLWSASGSAPERLFLRLAPDFSDGATGLQVLLNSVMLDVQGTYSYA